MINIMAMDDFGLYQARDTIALAWYKPIKSILDLRITRDVSLLMKINDFFFYSTIYNIIRLMFRNSRTSTYLVRLVLIMVLL